MMDVELVGRVPSDCASSPVNPSSPFIVKVDLQFWSLTPVLHHCCTPPATASRFSRVDQNFRINFFFTSSRLLDYFNSFAIN